jgi:hypothetical protein
MRVCPQCLWLVMATTACEKPTPATEDVPAPPGDERVVAEPGPGADAYAAYSFPPTDRAWTIADYEFARDVLVSIAQTKPELLLRMDGPRADVFARLVSFEEASRVAKAADVEQLLNLGDALAVIMKLYAVRVYADKDHGREYVAISAAYIHVAVVQFDAVSDRMGLTAAGLRKDEIRREGLMKMRHGLRTTFTGALQGPFELPGIVSGGELAEKLQPVASDVARFLLPEEVAELRGTIAKLVDVGASPAQAAALEKSLTGASERHPLVAAFMDEHRAFTRERDALLAKTMQSALSAVEVGPEGGGIRYAFPDRSMSAVFDVQPNALENTTTEDGAETTTRTLGIRDAVGFSRSIVCLVRRPTKKDKTFAKTVLTGMKANGIEAVKTSGHEGLEGRVENDTSHAVARVVDLGEWGCIIVAEYPKRIAAEAKPKARAFVDSVQLTPPPK